MKRTLTILALLGSVAVASVLASAFTITITLPQTGRAAIVVMLTKGGIEIQLPTCDARR
jgi:hypothetical protein